MIKIFIALVISLVCVESFADSFYAPVTGTAGASTQVLAANQLRGYLIIQNTGSTGIIVKFGSTISGSEGILIPGGGSYEPIQAPTNSVWLKAASSTPTYVVIQGNN